MRGGDGAPLGTGKNCQTVMRAYMSCSSQTVKKGSLLHASLAPTSAYLCWTVQLERHQKGKDVVQG